MGNPRTLAVAGIVVAGFLLVTLLAGCAQVHFAAGQLPRASAPLAAGLGGPASAAIRLRRDVVTSRDGWQVELRELVERVTEEAGLVERVAIEAADGAPAGTRYTVHLDLAIEEGRIGLWYGGLVFSTLGAVPAITTDRLVLTAEVRDAEGRPVRAYEVRDAMRVVVHPLMLLFIWLPGPEATATRVVENMVRTLYQRMADEGLRRRSDGGAR